MVLGEHVPRGRGRVEKRLGCRDHLALAAAAPKGLPEAALNGRGERLHAEALRRKEARQVRTRDEESEGLKQQTHRCQRLLRAALRRPGSASGIPFLLLLQLPLLLLTALHVNEGGDEGVLHLLLKVQLVPQGQLLHQLLREPPDVRLRLLQMLVELGDAQTPHLCRRQSRNLPLLVPNTTPSCCPTHLSQSRGLWRPTSGPQARGGLSERAAAPPPRHRSPALFPLSPQSPAKEKPR